VLPRENRLVGRFNFENVKRKGKLFNSGPLGLSVYNREDGRQTMASNSWEYLMPTLGHKVLHMSLHIQDAPRSTELLRDSTEQFKRSLSTKTCTSFTNPKLSL